MAGRGECGRMPGEERGGGDWERKERGWGVDGEGGMGVRFLGKRKEKKSIGIVYWGHED